MFPDDGSLGASGWNIYNCRCGMRTANDIDLEAEPRQIRVRDPETGRNVLVNDMTYKEWVEMKQAENKTAFDAYMKKGKNLSADTKQWKEYRSVLGNKAPGSVDDFQNLKYNDTENWERLKMFRRYKGRVPEASEKDFQMYLDVKATGVIGTIRVPPERINASLLTFKDEHAARHGCTVEDARNYVSSAYCSIKRERWDGISVNYYSADGAAYINKGMMKVKTAFSRANYDNEVKAIVEVFE